MIIAATRQAEKQDNFSFIFQKQPMGETGENTLSYRHLRWYDRCKKMYIADCFDMRNKKSQFAIIMERLKIAVEAKQRERCK